MLLDFIAGTATFQSLQEKAVNSVLLLFVLLMAQIWGPVFCSSAGQPGSGSGWSLFSGTPPLPCLMGAKGVGPNWQRCFPENKRRQLVPVLVLCLVVSGPSGTPGSSASLMSTWDRSCHLPSPPRGGRVPSCWHRLGLAAWGHKSRSRLGLDDPGQSQGAGKDGPLCAAAWGSNLRAMYGLHCLRFPRAGNGGKGVSRGLTVRASWGVA